jgi:protein TonB
MFADSLLDPSPSEREVRRRTRLSSFGLQGAAIAGILLFSMLRVERLPPAQWTSAIVAPAPRPAVAVERAPHAAMANIVAAHPLSTPSYEPRGIAPDVGPVTPPAVDVEHIGVSGSMGPGIPFSIGNALPVIVPPPAIHARPARISRMMEGNLVHRVQPVYPILARQARMQGSVVLRAVIDREGRIEKLQALSGPPVLEQAAIEAVQQWGYKPYLLDGEPIEVETQITVNFTLGGN